MEDNKHELPGWFPYAITASFLVMVGAGIKSNWGRAGKSSPSPTPLGPPVQQAGVLHDWAGVRFG